MALCTWDGLGSVFIISNYDGKPQDLRIKRFATGLSEPLGLKVVDEEIYVCQKQELTKLIDSDNDGRCDEFLCVSNAWDVSSNFHDKGGCPGLIRVCSQMPVVQLVVSVL